MTTFFASVLRLSVRRDGTIQPTQGHHAHAAFLDIVRQVDRELATVLHDANARKPFTLSQLYGLPVARRGEIHLRMGQECWLRVTLAGDEMFGTFIQRFLHGEARPAIRLGAVEFGVNAVLTTPGSHPWAGYTTAEALVDSARVDDVIVLEFTSPCGFSLGDNRVEIMPRSELVFGQLQKKWRQWCSLSLPTSLEPDWLRENVLVSEWRMGSRMLRYGQQVQVGSVGTVKFRLFNTDSAIRRTLNALAAFAFYAGIGRKTTQGMGQVRLTNESDKKGAAADAILGVNDLRAAK